MRGIEQIPWLYEIVCSLYERGGLAEWRRWMVAGASGQVLDLGSGTGRNLPLLPRGTKAVGLDPSLDALRRARRRAPAVPLVAGRAEALPFRDATFDTVLSGLVFCSVGDPRRGLDEVKRVLRPRGQLRMLEHVRSRAPWRARLQDLIQPLWTWAAGGCHPNRDTETAVERAGFRIEAEGRRAKGTNRRFAARVASRSIVLASTLSSACWLFLQAATVLLAACARQPEPAAVAIEYGRALYAGEPHAIDRLISAEDQRIRSEADFVQQQERHAGFTRELLAELASFIVATPRVRLAQRQRA